jgi:hypothetical protein
MIVAVVASERMMVVVNGGECDDLVMVVSWW